MEKQNSYPTLSEKHKIIEENEIQFNKFGIDQITSVSQVKLVCDDASLDNTDVKSMLSDDNESIIEELFEKNKVLQARWSIMQQQLCHYQKENERINQLLNEERSRATKFQMKLTYIQENQYVFEKLKQAYMNLKYNEQKYQNLIEVVESGTQTIILKQDASNHVCFNTESESTSLSIKSEDDCDVHLEPGFMAIKKMDFYSMKDTVETLSNLIVTNPLSTFVLTENKEAKYRKDIAELFMDNRSLKQLVVDQQIELDAAKQQMSLRKSSKETSLLKKIIAKLMKEIRSNHNGRVNSIEDYITYLNETERKIVDHISKKYELKLQLQLEGTSKNASRNSPEHGSTLSVAVPAIKAACDSKTSVEVPQSPPKIVKTPRCSTPFFTPRSNCMDGCDTFRSCDNDNS